MDCNWKQTTILLLIVKILLLLIDNTFSIQISYNCPNELYFDSTIYDCLRCPLNMVPRKDGIKIIKIYEFHIKLFRIYFFHFKYFYIKNLRFGLYM